MREPEREIEKESFFFVRKRNRIADASLHNAVFDDSLTSKYLSTRFYNSIQEKTNIRAYRLLKGGK